jgi:hypothetical protein
MEATDFSETTIHFNGPNCAVYQQIVLLEESLHAGDT